MSARTLLAGLLLITCLMPARSQSPDKPPSRPSPADALARRVDLRGFDDPKTTLAEAVEELARAGGTRIDIGRSVVGDGEPERGDAGKIELGEPPLTLPRGIPLARALDRVLARASEAAGRPLTYLVRPDGLEVVSVKEAVREVWGEEPGPYLPLVHRRYSRQPLDEALASLAADSGVNVVVDGRAGERARTPVTARFLNTPVDTAARLLADMADLKVVLRDNLLYVTTPDNAARLEARSRAAEPLTAPGEEPPGRRVGKGRWPFQSPTAPPAGQ